MRWLTSKTVGGKAFFKNTEPASLGGLPVRFSGSLPKLVLYFLFLKQKRSLGNHFFWGRQELKTRMSSTQNEDTTPPNKPIFFLMQVSFQGIYYCLVGLCSYPWWLLVFGCGGLKSATVLLWRVCFSYYYWCTDLLFRGKGLYHFWYLISVLRDELALHHGQVFVLCDLSVIRNMKLA